MTLFHWYRAQTYVPGHVERRSSSPWRETQSPGRVLVIRFHAIGDVALVLPACLALRRRYPDARIDLLTSPEAAPLGKAIQLFDSVFTVDQRANRFKTWSTPFSVGRRLRLEQYHVVLDLQRNWKTRWIRRLAHARSWGEFDRLGMLPACDRTIVTFREAGFHDLVPLFDPQFTPGALRSAESLLQAHGWHPGVQLVLLNPAGLWETRNWPLENYAEFARQWEKGNGAKFLLIGTERLHNASRYFAERIGSRLIDLSERTSLDVAFALLSFVDLLVTEDSGLMHMGWCLGKPVVALFGSSRHYWSLPTGEHVRAFHSGDLPCGACMQASCKYGDNRCLTRISPDAVVRAAREFMKARCMEQRVR